MSEKKRQKKDGERKDKKNKAMREAESERGGRVSSSQAAGDESNVTEPGTGATDNARQRGGNR